LDNNPATAKFLTPQERLWAVERLRSNNTGVETKEIKWNQVLETVIAIPTWLFSHFAAPIAVADIPSLGASVTNTL
jgi:hypothetical protein